MIVQKIVNRPVTVLILFIILTGLGLYSVLDLPVDLYPEIDPPIIIVMTSYASAGPEEVEKNVTRILEGNLSNISGLKEISSTSSEGSSFITLEFDWGADLAEQTNEVRDKIEAAKRSLPDDAETPQIFKFDPSSLPIMKLALRGNRDSSELRELADDIVQARLEQIDGVALVSVMGGQERIVRVDVSQNRLEAFDLTLTGISAALASQNIQIGGGSLSEGKKNFLIRTTGEFASIEEIAGAVVAYRGEERQPVLLKDVAAVEDGFKDETTAVIINGEEGAYVSVRKQSGTNSVRTADNVLEKIPEINRALPKGVELIVLDDTTKIIRASIDNLVSAAVQGAFLAMLVLFIFLRNIRTTLIIGLSIPISIIITLMAVRLTGLTLNMMTLAGLILGVGMIVDSSIVILENIYQYRQRGAKPVSAAVLGSHEMLSAITSSALTTVSVFIPLIVFKYQLDMLGVIFQGMIFTIIIAIVASLIVAVVLVPVLAGRFFPISTRVQKPLKQVLLRKLDGFFAAFFEGMNNLYRKILSAALAHRLLTILLVVSLFAGSIFLFPKIPLSFFPDMGNNSVTLKVELPVGSRLEETKDILRQMEEIIRTEIDGFKDIYYTAGSTGGAFQSEKEYAGEITVTLPDFEERIDDSASITKKLRSHFNDYPGAVFSISRNGPNSSSFPIDITIKSDNLSKVMETAANIEDLIRSQVPEVVEVSLDVSEAMPELQVVVDRNKAYALGLTTQAIGKEIQASIDGTTASIFRKDGKEYDIFLVLQESDRSRIPDLNKIFILNNSGIRIPLSSFAYLEKTSGPVDVKRESQSRTVHVQGSLAAGTQASKVENTIRDLVDAQLILDNVLVEYTGDWADILNTGIKLVILLLIAVGLVFGVMASQYESLKDPFINFFTIPLLFIGVVGIHLITGAAFSMFSAVGVIMLAGIVVNNGIVLVDYTNLLRGRGAKVMDACLEAGVSRLRPVLMTSLTTILGMVPMAFFPGEGSDMIQPIGITVIGGLTVSTFITLLLIPVIYSLFNKDSRPKETTDEKA